jgi:hypothetical protein
MTAAAATLKITTPKAVDMEIICYINKRIIKIISDSEIKTEDERETHHIRVRSTLPHIPLTLIPTPTRRCSLSSSRGRWVIPKPVGLGVLGR